MNWQPKHLTREQMAERRREGYRLLKAGWRPAAVARELGVSRAAVTQWKRRFEREGEAAFQVHKSSGRPTKLSAEQQEELLRLLEQGAEAWGYPTDRWTQLRVREVIRRKFGVKYHPTAVGRLLHRLGWSVQKPEVRAIERDEAAIADWKATQWPRIKKKPKENEP